MGTCISEAVCMGSPCCSTAGEMSPAATGLSLKYLVEVPDFDMSPELKY